MKIGRGITDSGETVWFSLQSENRYCLLDPSTLETGPEVSIKKYLAPATPSKVIAVGLNYRDHASEMGIEPPVEPVIFLKPPSSLIGPGDTIIYPPACSRLDYEAELAVVISSVCRNVSTEHAPAYILGYTCVNDVTARNLQFKDGQWTRAKSFDTFCPIGPIVTTDINDPHNLTIRSRLRGELRQESSTKNLIFNVFELVSFISSIMTLEPGDVIATGTPAGVGEMLPGDTVTVEIEDIGILQNTVSE